MNLLGRLVITGEKVLVSRGDISLIFVLRKNEFLIFAQKLVVTFARVVLLIVTAIVCHHLLHSLADPEGVSFWRHQEMSQIRNEIAFLLLLLNEVVRVDSSRLLEVLLESWLARQFPNVDLLRPKWMLAKVLPANALDWVFFQKASQQVIKNDRKLLDGLQRSFLDLGDQFSEARS